MNAKYQEAYSSHQKLQITDKKWQPSYNLLVEKKIQYLIALKSHNAFQAHFFDLTFPEYEELLQEQDRIMVHSLQEIYLSHLNIVHKLGEKADIKLQNVMQAAKALDPMSDIQQLLKKLNEEEVLSFEVSVFANQSSDSDSPYFTRDDLAISYMLKLYETLFEKLQKILADLKVSSHTVEGLASLMQTYQLDLTLGDYGKAHQAWMDAKEEESFLLLDEANLTSQLDQLSTLLKEEFEGGHKLQEHHFKAKGISFNSICDHCSGGIWGIKGSALICQGTYKIAIF